MKRARNLILFATINLALAVLITGAYLTSWQAQALVHPGSNKTDIRLPTGLTGGVTVRFTTEDGLQLEGWYIPPGESPGPALLFVHGLGGNRDQFRDEAGFLADAGYGMLLFDLRNHGTSEGEVTTMGLHEVRDVVGAFNFLADQPEIDPDRIVIYGHSMGGATAIRAMPLLPDARGLIVETAYISTLEVVADGITNVTGLPPFPWAQMTLAFANHAADADLRRVQPIDVIADIAPRPILFLHGDHDDIIELHHSRELHAAAGEPKSLVVIAGGGHGNLHEIAPEQVEAAILDLLTQAVGDG